ncbi:MAG: GNAT family N-acetyltransferase [Bacteroidia bacterium]|nr:GNAT family N-acetyltransferase [Bacteroidia bacterium]NNF30255.1 GNAT family N-acetyltransferase [Flavobacteriaceae bacterium]MBT8277326.1 GNAT family N-acetyltransferase [Bacteroidia bacterium]NNJ82815.1 GNAT family N-acetyltransferase [Flavobacteriaceae bacterium]NNK54262.1 GNAT family N-acetyltransferase [Flavobacteriaceae bacterium]
MNTLSGNKIILRALELTDLDFLYQLENDESVWEVSNTSTPYSKYVLKQYLENAHRDIYEVKQLRLVICTSEKMKPIGFIDLFDFEPRHSRIGVGIVIFKDTDRRKGYASEALKLVADYSFSHLKVHQLFANISEDNHVSIKLFEKLGFELSGSKREWIISEKGFKNELFYQLIHDKKS